MSNEARHLLYLWYWFHEFACIEIHMYSNSSPIVLVYIFLVESKFMVNEI